MAYRIITESVANLGDFGAIRSSGTKLPMLPAEIAHVYIKLDFKQEFENAKTAEDAKGFLRSVARASVAADRLANHHNGVLLEIQGSTLHVGLQKRENFSLAESAVNFVIDIHWTFRSLFADQTKRVQGWRMAGDVGQTLVVSGRGVHNDESYVSLGQSANRPAKHLYSQLSIPNEDDRVLKRFHFAMRDARFSKENIWIHQNLDNTKSSLTSLDDISRLSRSTEPKVRFLELGSSGNLVQFQALPIAPSRSAESPSPATPHTSFGWVMRADLDGFTSRVQQCFDNDQRLHELAQEFYRIMDAAAVFTAKHHRTLAQLPWAGDNFTAAAVFQSKGEYDDQLPQGIVELTLDFEKSLADMATESGFGGWAYGVAGGDAHGNSGGNVYLAGIELDGRRFLIGTGEGFGRSIQAFSDIDPKANEFVLYASDWDRTDQKYKDLFGTPVTVRKASSTLFKKGNTLKLIEARLQTATAATSTPITYSAGKTESVLARPYHP